MLYEDKSKLNINVVKKGVKDPAVTERIWAELKLNDNKILQENPSIRKMMYSMIDNNQDIFTTEDCKVGKTSWETFKIELLPNARPVNQRMRPLPPSLKDNLCSQLDLWPLVPVTKKTGEKRWVLDFRQVIDLSVTDSFPTPNISEILNSLGKSRCLDASNAYHAIEVEESSLPIMAFATVFGLYQFARMPFGLENTGASYCRFVQRLVDILGVPGIVAYLDNVLIHSADLDSHINLLNLVFSAHKEAGIRLNASKTHLFQEEVEYLGHLVSAEGDKLIPSYVQKITEWPLPQTGKELSAFLGFTNYYRDFYQVLRMLQLNLTVLKILGSLHGHQR